MMTRILITGAASGIGLAAAQYLSRGGAETILVDRNADALDAALAGSPGVVRLVGDVADEAWWNDHAPAIAGIDGALVNAGVAGAGNIDTLDFAEWRRILSINLDGAFLTMRAAMRALLARGRGGAIVATASIAGVKAEPGTAAYAVSKAGLIQLVRVAAREGAPHGIRVNAVAPGGVDTPIWDGMDFFRDMMAGHGGDRAAAMADLGGLATPLGRYAGAEEIAAQIAFLLGDGAASMTGAVLVADGGYSL